MELIKAEIASQADLQNLFNGKPVRAVVNGSVYYRSATQLFSYKPLTKEKGAYWADFKYIKNKGKFTMVKKSIGRKWYL